MHAESYQVCTIFHFACLTGNTGIVTVTVSAIIKYGILKNVRNAQRKAGVVDSLHPHTVIPGIKSGYRYEKEFFIGRKFLDGLAYGIYIMQ